MLKMGDKSAIEWTDATIKRFWSYVAIGEMNECWEWSAGRFTNGYGQFRVGPKKVKAHRVAFELTHGRPPKDLVLHSCDHPPCCNPAHFFEGSHADNAADRNTKGRSARFNLPHKYGEDNPAAKLCSGQVLEIRALRQSGKTLKEIAAAYSISKSQAGNIARGAAWQM